MQFSESEAAWTVVPRWVHFFIQLGYLWRPKPIHGRRIAIISTPCDSAAAGLVVLGALISDLERSDANDADSHLDHLLTYAQQHIKYCNACTLPKCKPEIKGCGFHVKASGRLRSNKKPKFRYVSSKTDFEKRQLVLEYPNPPGELGNCIHYLVNNDVLDFYIDGEPPVVTSKSDRSLADRPYDSIVEGSKIKSENLFRSYSGLCFAGRSAGEAETKRVCSTVRFKDETGEYLLDDLMAVNSWSSKGSISRTSFYNCRNKTLDYSVSSPALVVADGTTSLLEVLNKQEFQKSDVICVFKRDGENSSYSDLCNKVSTLKQWYFVDFELDLFYLLPDVPKGINLVVLKQRGEV